MLAHQRLGIELRRVAQSGQGVRAADIAQRDADVSQQSPTLGALDRAAGELRAELVLGQLEQRHQLRRVQIGAGPDGFVMRERTAKRFQGQAARQSSQP